MDYSLFFDIFFNGAKQNAIIIMTTEGIITDINTAFAMAFGYSKSELLGKHFRIFYGSGSKEAGA